MRLQSAIFTLPDALLDGGALRPGADKVLSILKMESVWLYAVTALDRAEAQALLCSAGIEGDFRGLLTEREAGCACGRRKRIPWSLPVRSRSWSRRRQRASARSLSAARQKGTSGGRCALSPTTSCRTTRTGSGWNKTAYEKRRTAASSFFHPYSFFSLGASKSALITLA